MALLGAMVKTLKNHYGESKETFIGFKEIKDRTAFGVAKYIFHNLEKYNCKDKLVAQTYDGASVIFSNLNGVQAKVKEIAPSALFTHCYAHKLNFVSINQKYARIHSTKRTQLLNEIVKKRIPRTAPTRWSSNFSVLLLSIIDNHFKWDSNTSLVSQGFLNWLMKDSTYFLLVVCNEIFVKTDTLFNVLQTKIVDISYCIKKINETNKSLQLLRSHFDDIYENFNCYSKKNNLIEKKSRNNKDNRQENKRIFLFILDIVCQQINQSPIKNSNIVFEMDKLALNCLEHNYGQFFDVMRLKINLVGIYNYEMLKSKSIKDLLTFIFENNLN
ncbi:hypothetical protein A3Q56_02895 [Intoshia linei]|uniref:DUF4371 domain-containing protein n=1 Tax=Intoshia linei TaxID=1819745 RepID=A0A177B519_9BILA|nr:hypothetical protein A3Q56_02895 [Intoshia linei]